MIMEDNTRYITNRIWNKILPPALLCNVFVLLVLHFGMFFLVSRFCPKQELVVYSAFLPFWYFFAVVESYFSVAGPQYFSIFKGAGKHPVAQQVFSEVFTAQLAFVIVGSLLAAWQMPHIVRFLGIPQESVPLAVSYGRLLFVCGVVDTTSSMMRLFVQADSLPKTGAVVAMIHTSGLFLGMYVCFCVLHRGLIAYYRSFLVVTICAVLIYFVLFICRKTTIKLRFRMIRWQTVRELASLSSNSMLTCGGGLVIAMLTTRWLMSVFGPASVTIFALLTMFSTCCDSLQKGFISSALSLIGVYRGEENIKGIRMVCRKGFLGGLYVQLGCMIFLLCFPGLISQWMHVLENFPGEASLAVRLFALCIPARYIFIFFSGYYVLCGYDKLMVFCTIVGDLLVYFLVTVFFLLILRDEHLCWLYCTCSWWLSLIALYLIIQWKKRRGNFRDMLLLPQHEPTGKRYYFLLKNRAEDFQDYRIMLDAFLRKQSVTPQHTDRIRHLFEELFIFAGEQIGNRKNAFFSIVITIREQDVEMALRYDSRESCLKSALNGGLTVLEPEQVAGAKILSRLSDSIYIDRVYGINYIRLTLNRS